jgi:hypothetical protein
VLNPRSFMTLVLACQLAKAALRPLSIGGRLRLSAIRIF